MSNYARMVYRLLSIQPITKPVISSVIYTAISSVVYFVNFFSTASRSSGSLFSHSCLRSSGTP